MVDFVCTSPAVAQTLQNSVQWQLLLKHLERNGIGANVWVDGEDQPVSVQIPDLPEIKASRPADAPQPKAVSGIS